MSEPNVFTEISKAAARSPSGTDLSMANLDVTVNTLSASAGVLGGFPVTALLDGTSPAAGWVFTNTTGASIVLKAISFIYQTPVTAACTIDIHKVVAGTGVPTGGFAVITGAAAVGSGGTAANTQVSFTLEALSNRTMAPLDKISVIFSVAPTGLVGGVLTLLF